MGRKIWIVGSCVALAGCLGPIDVEGNSEALEPPIPGVIDDPAFAAPVIETKCAFDDNVLALGTGDAFCSGQFVCPSGYEFFSGSCGCGCAPVGVRMDLGLNRMHVMPAVPIEALGLEYVPGIDAHQPSL